MAAATRRGAPECGIYVRIEPDYDFERTIKIMRDVFFVATRSEYERNMHVMEFPVPRSDEMHTELLGLIAYARKSGFVALVRNNAPVARDLHADGVLLEDEGDILAARTLLGETAIVGLRCGISEDMAADALDHGVDFVSFHCAAPHQHPPADLFARWSTRSDTPALADGDYTNDDCGPAVQAGASFIACGGFLTAHPAGSLQAAADILYAIDLALKRRAVN